MYDLSILIPARNEMFLANTVQDILQNKRANTEIIVVLDGKWPEQPLSQHECVNVIYLPQSIGQRAATNLAASIATGKYFMKVDAHCAFDEGFDEKLLQVIEPDMTLVPVMKNLHVFDWICSFCGTRIYQGPKPKECPECTSSEFEMDIIWKAKPSPNSTSYRFTPELEFKYFPEYKDRQIGDLVETMSLQGSCFMLHRDKYFGLNICDETWGSWGGQGSEVAIKTWLSGGRVLCYKKTWYAHLFRTQKDFSFPYPNPGNEQKKAKDNLRRVFLEHGWEHAIQPLTWLVEKFAPVPDWSNNNRNQDKNKFKGIVYYSDNKLDDHFMLPVRKQLCKSDLPIVVATRKDGYRNDGWDIDVFLVFSDGESGYMNMFTNILNGLKKLNTKYVFFAEHDVLYHPSHFDFIPPRDDTFYYNQHVYKVHGEFGFGLHYLCSQTSGLCANRELLIDHYERRIKYILDNDPGNRKDYIKMIRRIGFEPGTHGRIPELKSKSDIWMSEFPNIDIRHNENLTPSRWRKDQFRNQKYTKGWTGLCDAIPGWGKTLGRFDNFLMEIIDN